jgi:DNA-directed RNA polymerase specialized sigma subunit
MKPKEYLSQVRDTDLRISTKLEQLEQLRSYAEKTSSFASARKNSNAGDRIGKTVAKIIDLENEINADIDRLVETARSVRKAISQVDNKKHQLLLELRYLNNKTWEEIAVTMHYSLRNVYCIHGHALQKLKDVIVCHVESMI